MTLLSFEGNSSETAVEGKNQNKKQPKENFSGRISRGCPGKIRADVPGQKLRAAVETLEKEAFGCADVHDPGGGCKNTSGRKSSG